MHKNRTERWRKGWEDIKTALRQRCVERTKKLKYVEGKEVTWRKNAMKRIDERAAHGTLVGVLAPVIASVANNS